MIPEATGSRRPRSRGRRRIRNPSRARGASARETTENRGPGCPRRSRRSSADRASRWGSRPAARRRPRRRPRRSGTARRRTTPRGGEKEKAARMRLPLFLFFRRDPGVYLYSRENSARARGPPATRAIRRRAAVSKSATPRRPRRTLCRADRSRSRVGTTGPGLRPRLCRPGLGRRPRANESVLVFARTQPSTAPGTATQTRGASRGRPRMTPPGVPARRPRRSRDAAARPRRSS